jgi:hypothetical protein
MPFVLLAVLWTTVAMSVVFVMYMLVRPLAVRNRP